MASNSIKMKANMENGETVVKVLIKHPMETGRRKEKGTDKVIPKHFIQEVTCSHKGETIMTAEWAPTIAQNPLMTFTFTGGAPGEAVELSWKDNTGDSDSISVEIK